MQVLLRCTPEPSEDQAADVSLPLQRELTQTVSIPVVYPFTCLFTPHFQRLGNTTAPSPTKLSSLLADPEPPLPEADCEVDLLAEFHLTGSKAISVEAMEMHLDHSDSGILDSTVEPDDNGLPEVWRTGDMFAASWLLSVGPSESEGVASGTLHVRWKRLDHPFDAADNVATTVIPLPGLQPPISESAVIASYPTTVRLGEAVTMQYKIKNRSSTQMMRVGIEVESSDSWVLSGPRLIQRLSILPGETKTLRLQGIPHGTTGELSLPRFRVFEHLRPETIGGGDGVEDDPSTNTQQREMLVCREGASLHLPADEQGELSILVMP